MPSSIEKVTMRVPMGVRDLSIRLTSWYPDQLAGINQNQSCSQVHRPEDSPYILSGLRCHSFVRANVPASESDSRGSGFPYKVGLRHGSFYNSPNYRQPLRLPIFLISSQRNTVMSFSFSLFFSFSSLYLSLSPSLPLHPISVPVPHSRFE